MHIKWQCVVKVQEVDMEGLYCFLCELTTPEDGKTITLFRQTHLNGPFEEEPLDLSQRVSLFQICPSCQLSIKTGDLTLESHSDRLTEHEKLLMADYIRNPRTNLDLSNLRKCYTCEDHIDPFENVTSTLIKTEWFLKVMGYPDEHEGFFPLPIDHERQLREVFFPPDLFPETKRNAETENELIEIYRYQNRNTFIVNYECDDCAGESNYPQN